MDYKGHVCPVCNKVFENDDDVVVCPECGTPHHRDCYEELGHCINLNRHRENYDYRRECEVNSVEDEEITCSFCGAKNPVNSKFCNSCGKPLALNKSYSNGPNAEQTADSQGGFGGTIFMDPLGGVKADEDLGQNVKASEAAKFVKTSTPYFIPQFKQLKEKGRTRFSFVGFIFGGGWLLYRKMYAVGIVVCLIMALLLFGDLFTNVYYGEAVKAIDTAYSEMLDNMMRSYSLNFFAPIGDFFASLTDEQFVICIVRTCISLLNILIRVLCAIFGNRWYYKHTIKNISRIKTTSASQQEVDTKINTKGGVNVPLAFSLIICYYIIIYLPMFIN